MPVWNESTRIPDASTSASSMRILHLNTYHHLRGGDSRVMFETAAQLRAQGHEVRHFAMEHPQNVEDPDAEFFAPYVDFPELQRRGGLRNAVRVVATSIHNQRAREALGRMLDTWRPDVAHLHSVMHHLTASVVLELRERGIPIVWTLHDYKSVCPTTRLLRDGRPCEACKHGRFHQATLKRCKRDSLTASLITTVELGLHRMWRVYERADVLVAPSRFLRDKVTGMGLRPRRIEVLPNFVEVDRYDPASGVDEGYVLYVGRLSHEKGLPPLIEAMANVKGLGLRIAGTGELTESLQQRVEELGLDDVVFEGHVGGQRLADLYRGSRAVVVPSEWYENCPMVVLEAYAYGKPVVGSRLGGLVDLIDEDRTGKLVSPGDVLAWSQVLRRLSTDPATWHGMGENARYEAEEVYDAEPHMEALLEIYESVAR